MEEHEPKEAGPPFDPGLGADRIAQMMRDAAGEEGGDPATHFRIMDVLAKTYPKTDRAVLERFCCD